MTTMRSDMSRKHSMLSSKGWHLQWSGKEEDPISRHRPCQLRLSQRCKRRTQVTNTEQSAQQMHHVVILATSFAFANTVRMTTSCIIKGNINNAPQLRRQTKTTTINSCNYNNRITSSSKLSRSTMSLHRYDDVDWLLQTKLP